MVPGQQQADPEPEESGKKEPSTSPATWLIPYCSGITHSPPPGCQVWNFSLLPESPEHFLYLFITLCLQPYLRGDSSWPSSVCPKRWGSPAQPCHLVHTSSRGSGLASPGEASPAPLRSDLISLAPWTFYCSPCQMDPKLLTWGLNTACLKVSFFQKGGTFRMAECNALSATPSAAGWLWPPTIHSVLGFLPCLWRVLRTKENQWGFVK